MDRPAQGPTDPGVTATLIARASAACQPAPRKRARAPHGPAQARPHVLAKERDSLRALHATEADVLKLVLRTGFEARVGADQVGRVAEAAALDDLERLAVVERRGRPLPHVPGEV